MHQRRLKLLFDLLRQPTAPFREDRVVAWAVRALARAGIPFFEDPIGNIVIGANDAAAYRRLTRQRTPVPLRVFIAHMDHPGFHGLRWESRNRLRIKWHGGSPVRRLAGSRVWLADRSGTIAQGTLTEVRLGKSRRAIDTAVVRIGADALPTRPAAKTLFGGFDFHAPVWRVGKRVFTKAADDLVGTFAVVSTALDVFAGQRRRRPPFIGLLTRAEEVGFVGAIGHFELGWLSQGRRPVVCISLEASRTLPNARVGKGPVVRLGDRRTVFDPARLKVLSDVAEHVLPKRHQRRIMDGGACEAAVATAYDLPAIGISVPLGNYHNQSLEGGPDARRPDGPAPEFVHLDDVDGLPRLCRALMQPGLEWKRPWKTQRELMQKNLRRFRDLLR